MNYNELKARQRRAQARKYTTIMDDFEEEPWEWTPLGLLVLVVVALVYAFLGL